jgi:hypothetical protein
MPLVRLRAGHAALRSFRAGEMLYLPNSAVSTELEGAKDDAISTGIHHRVHPPSA